MIFSGWTKPANLAFFELKGPDAVRYLNGQVTNQIKVDLSAKVVPACVCTVKGKVEALVRVTAGFSSNSLLIEVGAAQSESVFARLDRYLIADDCELNVLETCPELIHTICDSPPHAGSREHWRYGIRGYDVFGPGDLTGLSEIPEEVLIEAKIRHGIPEFGFEITGDEFPAGLGLDTWAVDFHKGCYLGQEVVSRIENAGKVPLRLRLFSTDRPFEKDKRFENEAGKTLARVTRNSIHQSDASGKFLTLLMAKDGFSEPGFEEIPIIPPPKS